MTKKPTLVEQRIALQQQTDQIDLDRANRLIEIFSSPAMVDAMEQLEALSDPSDTTALARPGSSDITACIANALVPFRNCPDIATRLAAQLYAKINPPKEEEAPSPTV